MLKTKHNPVRVKDPLSENHGVVLHPTQGFDLHLTPFFGRPEIKVYSDFFRVDEKQTYEGHTVYRFGQKFDLADWAEVSKTYLGDVVILSDKIDKNVALRVVLDANDHRDILTVLNPDKKEIRMEVGDQIEVVLFDKALAPKDIWEYQFVPPANGLRYELADQQILQGDTTKHHLAIRRSLGWLEPSQPESHFWFKIDMSSQIALTALAEGTYDAGKLVFDAGSGNEFRRELDIRLLVRKKKEKQTSTLVTSSSGTIKTSSTGKIIHPPTTAMVLAGSGTSTSSYPVRSSSSSEYGWPEHSQSDGKQDWDKNRRKHIHVSEPYEPNRRKKVKLKQKEADLMEHGCNMLYFENGRLVGGTYTAIPESEEEAYLCMM